MDKLDLLLSNEGYDLAVIMFEKRQPMPVARQSCTISVEGNCLKIVVPNGPHPMEEGKRASATHYIPLEEICGISYFTENRVVTMPIMEPVTD